MLFCPYLEMHTGSWKQHSKHHHQKWTPSQLFLWFFPIFLVFSFSIAMHSYLEMWPDPENIAQDDLPLWFLPCLFFIQHSHTFHIWKCTLDSENSTPNIITNSEQHPSLFILFFPISLLFFMSIATLSLFENVHCTLKALPNIITNSEHHPLFCPEKFTLFYCCFSFAKAPISIWKWTLDPENSAQCCHQQWAPLLSSPIHPTALPKWLQQV